MIKETAVALLVFLITIAELGAVFALGVIIIAALVCICCSILDKIFKYFDEGGGL